MKRKSFKKRTKSLYKLMKMNVGKKRYRVYIMSLTVMVIFMCAFTINDHDLVYTLEQYLSRQQLEDNVTWTSDRSNNVAG